MLGVWILRQLRPSIFIRIVLVLTLIFFALYYWKQRAESEIVQKMQTYSGKVELSYNQGLKDKNPIAPQQIEKEQAEPIQIAGVKNKILPHGLGHYLFPLDSLFLQDFDEEDLRRVIDVHYLENIGFLVNFKNKGSVLFRREGVQTEFPELNGSEIRVQGIHILTKEAQSFDLYHLNTNTLEKRSSFDLQQIKERIVSDSLFGSLDGDLNMSDFAFNIKGEELTIWLFYPGTAAIPPNYAHLIVNGTIGSPKLTVTKVFGLPTLADRLPRHGKPARVTRNGNLFWVPRINDQQIDIFTLNGSLNATIQLLPYLDETHLLSPDLLRRSLNTDDPNEISHYVNNSVSVLGIIDLGDFKGILRSRPTGIGNRKQTIDLYDTNLNPIIPDLPGIEPLFVGNQDGFGIILMRVDEHEIGAMSSISDITTGGYYLIRVHTREENKVRDF